MKLRFLFFLLFLVIYRSLFLNAQPTISGTINIYTPVISFSGCDMSTLDVGSTLGFSPGDEVLLIQMKGATIDLTNSSSFGNILNIGNGGNFELNRVKSTSGNQIQLTYKPIKSYDISGKVQLVRIPEYDDVTANGLTCKAWDGTIGGVFIIDVKGKLILQGNVDVSAKGFRGGTVLDVDSYDISHMTDFFYPNPDTAGAKGEGIAIISANQNFGRGKSGNGGGGGNAHNGGGGGGR